MINRVLPIAAFSLLSATALANEYTVERYIYDFNLDSAQNTHYFRATTTAPSSTKVGWGAPSCPNAEYVYTRELLGQKDVLATVMMAVASGHSVSFFGTCDAGGIYFRATRVIFKP